MTKTLHLVLIGDTRSGKTSFANTISKDPEWGKVGENDGESTTIDVHVCSAELDDGSTVLSIFDTPGINDSRLRLTNRQIKQRIEMSLLSSLSTHVDAFIITESLQGEQIGIRRNAKNLVSIFGQDALKSTLVLLTKECYNNARSVSRQKVCSELPCPFVFWKNNFKDEYENEGTWVTLSEDELAAQTQELLATVDRLPNFSMTNLVNMKNEIERKAKLLQENEPVQYESVGVDLQVPYLESKTVGVVKQRPVIHEKERGGLPGFFGATKIEIEYQNYTEDQIVYEEKTRNETRQEQVALPKKSLDHYIEIVKKDMLKEFTGKLAK